MHPIRRRRITVILLAISVFSIISFLVMYALRQNINLFFTPSDVALQKIKHNKLIRLGGLVVPGSVQRNSKDLLVNFQITDNKNQVTVVYTGVLPDLFREGQSIVTQGYIQKDNKFQAIEVLAKHDENYVPKEIKEALSKRAES